MGDREIVVLDAWKEQYLFSELFSIILFADFVKKRCQEWVLTPFSLFFTFLFHFSFSAIKRKFGDAVRSKCDFAMVNEVLCKILCHNIRCLIQEQCELGIEPIFWKEAERQEMEEGGYLRVTRA